MQHAEHRGIHRMSMNHRADIRPRTVNAKVHAGFHRRLAASLCNAAVRVHDHNVVGCQRVVRHGRRRKVHKTGLWVADADVPPRFHRKAAVQHPSAGLYHNFPAVHRRTLPLLFLFILVFRRERVNGFSRITALRNSGRALCGTLPGGKGREPSGHRPLKL